MSEIPEILLSVWNEKTGWDITFIKNAPIETIVDKLFEKRELFELHKRAQPSLEKEIENIEELTQKKDKRLKRKLVYELVTSIKENVKIDERIFTDKTLT